MPRNLAGIHCWLLSAGLAFGLSRASFAQEPAQPPSTLAEALAKTPWDAAGRGPLLAVAPERTFWHQSGGGRLTVPPPAPPPRGFDLKEIAPYFGQIVVRAGGVTVLAPATLRALRVPTLSPEAAALLERGAAGRELFASFSPAQWSRVASAEGLGAEDLTEKQRPLFFTVLPSLYLRPVRLGAGRRPDPVALDDDRRAAVRLRLSRRIQLMFLFEGAEGDHLVSFGDSDEEGPRRNPPRDYAIEVRHDADDPLTRLVAPQVPNQQKRSDLPFADRVLHPPIALEGARTLGEFVRRAADATGLDLIADARIAPLPVWVKGESARSGDVLQALCRAVGGAFRRLDTDTGTIYLLTWDREGLGVLQARYAEWRMQADTLRSQRDQERQKARAQAGGALPVPYEEPYDLPESFQEKMEALRRQRFSGKSILPGFAVGDLPPALQERVRKTLARHPTFDFFEGEAGTRQTRTLRTDRVVVDSSLRLQVLLPEIGEAEDWNAASYLSSLDNAGYVPPESSAPPSGPIALPAAWRERVLAVTPATADEAKAAVQLAREHGLNALWLEVPGRAATAKPLLAAAVAAGKEEGIAVGALVRPFLVPADALPEGAVADINILGETFAETAARQAKRALPGSFRPPAHRVYLEPTSDTRKALLRELRAISAISGLAGLALNEMTPPGYGSEIYGGPTGEQGYAYANRIAFLRQSGCDPIDLPGEGYNDSRHDPLYFGRYTPFGPNPVDLQPDWRRFRAGRIAGWNRDLFEALRAAAPDLRLFLNPNLGSLFGAWERADARLATDSVRSTADYFAALRAFSKTLLISMISRSERPENLRASLAQWIQGNLSAERPPYSGIVFDLTGQPLADASRQLDALGLGRGAKTAR